MRAARGTEAVPGERGLPVRTGEPGAEVLGRRVPRRLVPVGVLPADPYERGLQPRYVAGVVGDPGRPGRQVAADAAAQQELGDQGGGAVVHGVVVGQRAQQVGGRRGGRTGLGDPLFRTDRVGSGAVEADRGEQGGGRELRVGTAHFGLRVAFAQGGDHPGQRGTGEVVLVPGGEVLRDGEHDWGVHERLLVGVETGHGVRVLGGRDPGGLGRGGGDPDVRLRADVPLRVGVLVPGLLPGVRLPGERGDPVGGARAVDGDAAAPAAVAGGVLVRRQIGLRRRAHRRFEVGVGQDPQFQRWPAGGGTAGEGDDAVGAEAHRGEGENDGEGEGRGADDGAQCGDRRG